MFWAVVVPGQKLRCHGVTVEERAVALLRRGRLIDGNRALLRLAVPLEAEVSAALLADQGCAVLAARPFYDPEPELQRLWEEGWQVQAEELGVYLLRGREGKSPTDAFPGAEPLVGQGATAFWARLRLAGRGAQDDALDVGLLHLAGLSPRGIDQLRRRGIATVGELQRALRHRSVDLPTRVAEHLERALAGEEVLPFCPWHPPPTVLRQRDLPGGTADWPVLQRLVERLVAESVRELRGMGLGVGQAELTLSGEGRSWTVGGRFSPAVGQERLRARLAARLVALRLDRAVEQVSLRCVGAPLSPSARGLFAAEAGPLPSGLQSLAATRRELRLSLYDPWRLGGRMPWPASSTAR